MSSHRLPTGGMDAQGGHQALGQILIQSNGAAQIPRTGVGNAQQVKGSLHPAILPTGAVKGQENHISPPAQFQHTGSEQAASPIGTRRPELFQVRLLTGHLGALPG